MNQQTASIGGTMSSFKWAIVFALIALGVTANYLFSDQSLLLRVVALFFLGALVLLLALTTDQGKRFWGFTLEARAEMRKVVWPTRQETIQTTGLVLAVVAIVGLILWGVDIVLLKAVAWLTGYGAS